MSIFPAICSAIAAICSAAAALTLMVIHLRNREDSVKPEIVLDGWSFQEREGMPGWGSIRIAKIHNEGKGPALHISGQLNPAGEKKAPPEFPPLFHADTIAILPSGKETAVNWEALFHWESIAIDPPELSTALLALTVFMYDIHGRLHELIYEMLATKDRRPVAGVMTLAPRLFLSRRYPEITSGWQLRVRGHKGKIANAVARLRKRIEESRLGQVVSQKLAQTVAVKTLPGRRSHPLSECKGDT